MKTLNETFTDEEYAKLMRIKKHVKLSWHDLLLDSFSRAEQNIKLALKKEGKTEEEINAFFE